MYKFADGDEEPLDDPQPLKNLQRKDAKRVQLFLRYKDPEPDRTTLKIYGGWLRMPVTFCRLTITKDTTIENILQEAVSRFGLLSSTYKLYNIVEVSLERGGTHKNFFYCISV